MALKSRIRLRTFGMPEAIGLGLLAVTFVSSAVALAAFLRPEVQQETARTAQAPLTEDALRQLLRDLEMQFHFDEHAPAGNPDATKFDGSVNGAGSRVVVSQGDGAITVSLPESNAQALVRAAGLGGMRLPAQRPWLTWASTAAVAYVLTVYYFCTAYPAWRRGDWA